jgi:predicted TIM-barrel fold metal-dependent hydrolase
MAALRDRYPGRYLLYATVDIPVAETAADQLEHQVKEYGVDGLKLYPVMFYDGTVRGWRLDDDLATPLLEAAHDLGIRNIAIHKAIPVPPAPAEMFRVDDFEATLDRFPTINFHMVHAGVAFVEETAGLLARHGNLYANLESSFSYLLTKPRRFAESVGPLLAAAGSERLLFGSGVNLTHPRPLLEAFDRFEMPADLVEDRGFPVLTADDRRKIVGGNALRVHGLTPTDVRAGIAGDRFEALKAEGLQAPWSLVRPGSQ